MLSCCDLLKTAFSKSSLSFSSSPFLFDTKFASIKPDIGYPGAPTAKLTTDFNLKTKPNEVIPIFQILNENGEVVNKEYIKEINKMLSKEDMTKMYSNMRLIRLIDELFVVAQRQGRISSYLTNTGEEGVQMGCSESLRDGDVVYSQYREHLVMMHRGFTLKEMLNQCLSTEDDYLKGRRMPIHYGSKKVGCIPISAPLSNQVPQAAGHGYSLRMDKKDNVAVVFFGDGSASEGDVYCGMNIAATRKSHTIFMCRNNGFAISTPVNEQYKGDGIAPRALALGIPYIRADGMDVLASYFAVSNARKYSIENHSPVLVETMGYRLCNHTTSDDSLKYRAKDELDYWRDNHDPLIRFRNYLTNEGIWSDEIEKNFLKEKKKEITSTLKLLEKKNKVGLDKLCDDVFYEKTKRLDKQLKFITEIANKYPNQYGNH